MLNGGKLKLWIIVAVAAACVVASVRFLTNLKNAPVSFDKMQIIWAKALDQRPNEPVSRDLNDAQLEELKSRLLHLNVGRKDSDFGGLTPMYSLSMQAQHTPQFAISGYDIDGNELALFYEGEYYRISDIAFSRYLSAVCAGEDTASAEGQALSLNAVIQLSQKGEALTWEDFDSYPCVETGSGLYIRAYAIDDQFSLMIGGGSTDEIPMYIRLVNKHNPDDYIDIRVEDVEAFIRTRSR